MAWRERGSGASIGPPAVWPPASALSPGPGYEFLGFRTWTSLDQGFGTLPGLFHNHEL